MEFDFGDVAGGGLEDFADLEGVPLTMAPQINWLSKHDAAALETFKEGIPLKLLTYTLLWTAIHVASVVLCSIFCKPSTMSEKDRCNWHNKYGTPCLHCMCC